MKVHIVGGSYSGRELEFDFLDGDDIELVRWEHSDQPWPPYGARGVCERYKVARYSTLDNGQQRAYLVAFYVGDK